MLETVCGLCCILESGEQQPCTPGHPTYSLPNIWGFLKTSWGSPRSPSSILNTAANSPTSMGLERTGSLFKDIPQEVAMLALTASHAQPVLRFGINEVSCSDRQNTGCICSSSRFCKHVTRNQCGVLRRTFKPKPARRVGPSSREYLDRTGLFRELWWSIPVRLIVATRCA